MQTEIFDVYVYDNKNHAVQDAYAMLSANIHIRKDEKALKTLAVTSSNPEEGKTSLAINLSITTANSGWKVLLIDADMRKPPGAKRLNKGALLGLSDYLAGDAELSDVICETNVENFAYLACGTDRSDPSGLLCSARFEGLMDKARNEYDLVLFDTPALSSVVDGLLVASKVDATLLVVKMGSTKLTSLIRVKQLLENANANILGAVLNQVKRRDYKIYFGFYDYFFNSKRFLQNKKMKRLNLPEDNQTSKNVVTM